MIVTRRLRPGMPAPSLSLPLAGGGTFDIGTAKIDRFLLIDIYRGYHCPRCRRHLLELEGFAAHFARRGVSVVAASTDSEERAAKSKAEWGLDTLAVAYGMGIADIESWDLFASTPISEREPQKPFAEPATFLVAPDRTVYGAVINSNPFNRLHFADMLEAIDTIAARDYPPRGTFNANAS